MPKNKVAMTRHNTFFILTKLNFVCPLLYIVHSIFLAIAQKEGGKKGLWKKPFVVTKQFLSIVFKFYIIKIPSFDDWQKYGKYSAIVNQRHVTMGL